MTATIRTRLVVEDVGAIAGSAARCERIAPR
jgi:hypothetical protein